MDPLLKKQLQSMDHPFFKERPKGDEPFFAKRLREMDPFYTQMRKEIDIQVREMSRSSTLNDSSKESSRTSTFDVEARDFSRASTLKVESPEIIKKAQRGRRSWTWAVVSQTISVLWLAPIIALLILNFKAYVIGASIWCPRGNCAADPFGAFGEESMKMKANLDSQDHDVMGALQFVSKALEVWFMFISTSLVYDVAMLLAKKGGGLPVGFLLTHLEFADIRYLLNPLLWTSPIPHPTGSPRLQTITGRLYLFVLLAASLTILTNLMGPATAVLILPTLQWIETPRLPEMVFNGTNAQYSPWGKDVLPGCSLVQLTSYQFSCTEEVYGPSLDSYADHTAASRMQVVREGGPFLYTISQEGSVQFAINMSESGNDVVWSPNRQALRYLSYDVMSLDIGSYGIENEVLNSSMVRFNNSLAAVIEKQSISLAISTQCFYGDRTVYQVDELRNVVCFDGWRMEDNGVETGNIYKMCIRVGLWDAPVFDSTFFIGHPSAASHKEKAKIKVKTYFSDQATLYNRTTDFGTGIASCLEKDKACDWDKIFAAELPLDFRNMTKNVQIVEYSVPKASSPDAKFWCFWYTYLGFPTYSMEFSPHSNPLALVQLNNLPDVRSSDTPIVMHPDWMLAAWSVENEGTVDGDRPMSKAVSRTLPTSSQKWEDPDMQEIWYLHSYCVCQAASLVDWSFSADTTNSTIVASSTGPIFYHYATLHQWAYGLSDRTSQLGVAVVLLGVVCVLIRLILAVTFRFRHEHSAVELFVAALEHKSQGEFEGLDDELELARVRFEMKEDEYGKPKFVAERRGTGFSDTSNDGFLKAKT
ncbi:hypothetical protein MMC07_002716 [Pseudocyphellaria aurata]|nr:hypothetical protein [Pseudocyphellaria aurata]